MDVLEDYDIYRPEFINRELSPLMYLVPNVSLKSKKIIFVVKCFIYYKYSFLITNYRQSNVILYPFTDRTMYCVNDLVRTRK